MIFRLLIFTFLLTFNHLFGQENSDSTAEFVDTLTGQEIKNLDFVYNSKIRTVKIHALNSDFSEPIISIFPGSKIELSFDDFSDDFIEYYYQLVHCDVNWKPHSELMNVFYLSSFSHSIEDYSFSSATKAAYTRYKLILPGQGEKFLRSGNFLIHIKSRDSDSLILTKRFMVVDPSLSISGQVARSDDVRFANYKQQIQFEIYDSKDNLKDLGDLYIRISKNASWDITCEDIKPSFVNNNKLIFQRSDACLFDGGNEYRFFNMLEFRYISTNVARIDVGARPFYHLWLEPEKSRAFLRYSTMDDFNGKTVYGSTSKTFPLNELDYAFVHFSFKPDENMLGYELYVYGELSNFQIEEGFKMVYNPEKNTYELTKLLKQGLYNYMIVVKSIYQDGPDETMIEGSHFETENSYCIYAYYRNAFEGYDQLLGIERIQSRIKLDK